MTTRKLRALLAVWQRRLRLQDHAITVRFVRNLQSDGHDCYGLCWPDRDAPGAAIEIRSNPCSDGSTRPAELILIHELLHVLIPAILPGEAEEPAINKLAHALFAAYE